MSKSNNDFLKLMKKQKKRKFVNGMLLFFFDATISFILSIVFTEYIFKNVDVDIKIGAVYVLAIFACIRSK